MVFFTDFMPCDDLLRAADMKHILPPLSSVKLFKIRFVILILDMVSSSTFGGSSNLVSV